MPVGLARSVVSACAVSAASAALLRMMNCRCACAWNAFHAPSDGAGTVSSIRLMASSVVRRRRWASAVSLMRCDRHGDRQILDIVRHHVSAPVGGRPDARAAGQRQRASHGRADGDVLVMTGRLDDAHDVFEDVVVDVDALSDAAQREDVIAGKHGGDGLRAVADVDLPQEVDAYLMAGVPDRRLDEETVHLGFGQLVCAELFDRVLRGDHDERLRHVVCAPSTVTFCSSMTSSSADWVFGEARLISSASTMDANTGPSRNSNSPCFWS